MQGPYRSQHNKTIPKALQTESALTVGEDILLYRIVNLLVDIEDNFYRRNYRRRDIHDLVLTISKKVKAGEIPINLLDFHTKGRLLEFTIHGARDQQMDFLTEVANHLQRKKSNSRDVRMKEHQKKLRSRSNGDGRH